MESCSNKNLVKKGHFCFLAFECCFFRVLPFTLTNLIFFDTFKSMELLFIDNIRLFGNFVWRFHEISVEVFIIQNA